MSDLPLSALDYRAVVSEFFLSVRGAGLLVSPLDDELVAEWQRRGLPVAVVCRGLRRGAEALTGERRPPPRSIRALRLAVEDEWRAYRAGRVGDAPPPPSEDGVARGRIDAARAHLEAGAREGPAPHRGAYRAAARALEETLAAGARLEGVEAAIAAADAALLVAWVGSLPRAERAALGPRLRLLAGVRTRGASPRAHRDALRAHLQDLARRAGLSPLRGSV